MSGRLWIWFLVGAAALLCLYLLTWSLPRLINATGEGLLGPSGLLGRAGQRQLAEVRSEMAKGLSRQEVYARLKARRLVAFSTDYPIESRDPETGEWKGGPSLEYPPSSFRAARLDGRTYLVKHAEVWVSIGLGWPALGCGREVDLTIEFDDHDKVRELNYSEPQDECM